jgi:ABC-type dipeptide/oligopeptide/nickel transport system ATPase component
MGTSKLLEAHDLQVDIRTDAGVVYAVRGVNFSLERGETLAVVGESGSGKSITFKAVMGLLPAGGRVSAGEVLLEGRDIAHIGERAMRGIRGADISMIFQDPMTSLNPTMTVGKQIDEMLRLHRRSMDAPQRRARCMDLLELVGIPARRNG